MPTDANIESPFIGAYWSARRETRAECALRVAQFLQSISDHVLFGHWYLNARSRKAASVPLPLSADHIAQRLKTNNRDTDGSPIEELGFSLGVWNGNDESPASFHITCGVYSPFVKNASVLTLPPQSVPLAPAVAGLYRTLLEKSVQACDPEDAVATSTESLARAEAMPWAAGGWFVYRRGQGITQS